MYYASYASGFKPGSHNASAEFWSLMYQHCSRATAQARALPCRPPQETRPRRLLALTATMLPFSRTGLLRSPTSAMCTSATSTAPWRKWQRCTKRLQTGCTRISSRPPVRCHVQATFQSGRARSCATQPHLLSKESFYPVPLPTFLQPLARPLVGGPTAAFPEWEVRNFSLWDSVMGTFLRGAGMSMEFLSVHLYSTQQDYSIRDVAPRDPNNLDAILDLHEAASLNVTGRRLPHVISEYGTSFKEEKLPYTPAYYFNIMQSVNAKMLTLLRRPDRILKVR